jgi:hypothetical protein
VPKHKSIRVLKSVRQSLLANINYEFVGGKVRPSALLGISGSGGKIGRSFLTTPTACTPSSMQF